jgi:uracil-DNA glycosylase
MNARRRVKRGLGQRREPVQGRIIEHHVSSRDHVPGQHPDRPTQDGPGAAATISRQLNSLEELRVAVNTCRRCQLWRDATQGVPGEGPRNARIMLVGEQPGDAEDTAGHPFVGPAGAVLDRALHDAQIDRNELFVTNAVKHFKFEPRGKRRLHAKPNVEEIEACRWWLTEELKLVAPRLVVALGATAARSLLGHSVTVAAMRGLPTPFQNDAHMWVTIHPSYLLRMQDDSQQRAEYARFVQDLQDAKAWADGRHR